MSKEIETANLIILELQQQVAILQMEKENMELQLRGPSALPLDCVGYVTLKYMSDGALGISGNIGDVPLCMRLLDAARDAIKRNGQKTNVDAPKLVSPNGQPAMHIPARDVDAKQTIPTHAFGDAPPGQRGDMPPA